MNTIKITTSQNIELEYDLASLGERIAGRIFDLFILAAYGFLLYFILSPFKYNSVSAGQVLTIVIFLFPIIFYDLLSELMMNGQSVGKKIMKIKVISINGGRASFGQFMIRWLFRLVDFTLTNGICALICVAISQNKQRVGDIVAGTTLIKTNPRTALLQTLYVPVKEDNYKVSYPEVIELSDKDMQLVKEVIISVTKSGNTLVALKAAEKIKQILNIQTNLEPLYFLEVLIADYNYLTAKE